MCIRDRAYTALHQAGFAHSVETWIDGELVGGLYCVAVGRAVFGAVSYTHLDVYKRQQQAEAQHGAGHPDKIDHPA